MLNIAVIVSPTLNVSTLDDPQNVQREVSIVKSAILYGDKVELFSTTFNLNALHAQLLFQNNRVKARFIADEVKLQAQVFRNVDRTKLPNKVKEFTTFIDAIDRLSTRMGKDLFIREIEDGLSGNEEKDRQKLKARLKSNGVASLMKAYDAGLLDINVERSPLEIFNEIERNENTYDSFLIKRIVEKSLYPMFDWETVERFKSYKLATREKRVSERAKQTAFALSLFEQLPNFQNATIDEIIDIRRELQRPLERFRAKIMEIADGVKTDVWDREFRMSAEDEYRKKILPEIEDIRDACKSNKMIKKIINSKLNAPGLLTVGAQIVSSTTNLNLSLATILGVGATAREVYKAYQKYSDEKRTIEAKPLFFYEILNRKLG